MAALYEVQVPPGSSKRRGQMATPGERAKADKNPENMVCQLGLSNYENGTGAAFQKSCNRGTWGDHDHEGSVISGVRISG